MDTSQAKGFNDHIRRLRRRVEAAQAAVADAEQALLTAQHELERWVEVKRLSSGAPLVCVVVDHNQGYEVTFDYLKVWNSSIEEIKQLDRKSQRAHQAGGAEEFMADFVKRGWWCEFMGTSKHLDVLHDVLINAPKGMY